MKKIGILTLPPNGNYGGVLQCAALYGYLSDQGHEVTLIANSEFIDRPFWQRVLISILEIIPFQNIKNFRRAFIFQKQFFSIHIPRQSSRVTSQEELLEITSHEGFDTVIVGSDQVWRWEYIKDSFGRYFLDFVDRTATRKISYAASFGNDRWEGLECAAIVRNLMSDFHAVSVRESSAVDMCLEFGRLDCIHVLDPTLLVSREFYDRFSSPKKEPEKHPYLLAYILDSSKNKSAVIDHALNTLGKGYSLRQIGHNSLTTIPQWISKFRDSDFVITDSFHGMVFSIIFRKRFIVLGNESRGLSRFTSLLDQLCLTNRFVPFAQLDKQLLESVIEEEINYDAVDDKLSALRATSEKFLHAAIDG